MARSYAARVARRDAARATLARCGVPIGEDFHALPRSAVDALLIHARRERYRRPRNAPGSLARMFCESLQRRARDFAFSGWV